MSRYANSQRLLVQAHGETRELTVFSEARSIDATAVAEVMRWARDAQGRWYSFSSLDQGRVVESLSGDWFCILA